LRGAPHPPACPTTHVATAPQGSAPHAVGWHERPTGTLRVVKDLPGRASGAGPATFQGEGPMAALVGGNGAAGASLWSVYDLTGRVERLPAE
jgi:hypothetical protein